MESRLWAQALTESRQWAQLESRQWAQILESRQRAQSLESRQWTQLYLESRQWAHVIISKIASGRMRLNASACIITLAYISARIRLLAFMCSH